MDLCCAASLLVLEHDPDLRYASIDQGIEVCDPHGDEQSDQCNYCPGSEFLYTVSEWYKEPEDTQETTRLTYRLVKDELRTIHWQRPKDDLAKEGH
jgi:hypothetical protein